MCALLQSIYRATLLAAGIMSIASYIGVVILLLSSTIPAGVSVAVCVAPVILGFMVVSLVLRWRGRDELCIPTSTKIHTAMTVVVTLVAVTWFAIGIARWPGAPLRHQGKSFVDKRGRIYDEQSYRSFRRWEATLPLAGLPFALVAITGVPAADKKRVRTC